MPSNFELDKGDQFIVAFDTSGSMQTADCGGDTRFNYVLETMRVFIREASKWDPDGVSFYAFSSKLQEFPDIQSVEEIDQKIAALRPGGNTQTHLAIQAAYAEHARKGSAQTFFLVFTDGEPSDPVAVQRAIVDITNKVKDEKEFRISILTVGERSSELNRWLDDLDNKLTGAKFDIVAVNKLEEVDFQSAVDNAISG